ncbi:MAG: hypothetical protein IJH39_04150 [Clostridia bacterium]|nr:hypothetical protein [Clostridia bacterium]
MIKSRDLAAIKAGEMSVDTLLEKYPVKTVVSDLIEIVANKETCCAVAEPVKPISVTQEEYDKILGMFRVKGFTADGQVSHRGRKPKKAEN